MGGMHGEPWNLTIRDLKNFTRYPTLTQIFTTTTKSQDCILVETFTKDIWILLSHRNIFHISKYPLLSQNDKISEIYIYIKKNRK